MNIATLQRANTVLRTVAITLMLALGVGTMVYLLKTLKNTSESTAHMSKVTERLDHAFNDDYLRNVKNYGDMIASSATLNANNYGEIANSITDTLHRQVDPTVQELRTQTKGIGDSINKMVVDLNQRTNAQLDSSTKLTDQLTTLALTAQYGMASTFDELEARLDELGKITQRVDVLIEGKALDQIRDSAAASMLEIQGVAANLNKVTANTDVITKDVADTTTYFKGKIIPKPRVYSKSPVKRFFQKGGLFVWELVKANATTALLVLRFVQATQ